MAKRIGSLAILLAIIVTFVACGDNPSGPTATGQSSSTDVTSPTPAPSAEPTVVTPPTPPAPGANSPTPVFRLVSSPNLKNIRGTCYEGTADDLRWILQVSDAGNNGARLQTMVHRSLAAGCEPTTEDGRNRVVVSGVENYTPHSSGTTNFLYVAREWTCGRVQVDVTVDPITGKTGPLPIGVILNYGVDCAPPPPPPPPSSPSCSATITPGKVKVGEFATMTVKTTNANQAMIGNDTINLDAKGVGIVTLKAQPEWVGTKEFTITVSDGGTERTCSAPLVVESPAPAQCTLSISGEWQDTARAVRYMISANPGNPNNPQAVARLVWDGGESTQENVGVDLDQFRFIGYPVLDSKTHTVEIQAELKHANGTVCKVVKTFTIPASPSCEVQNPPRFDVPVWINTNPLKDITASVTVYNFALWKVVLHARNSKTGKMWEKKISQHLVTCGDQKTLRVGYDWAKHEADKWWVEVYKDGVSVYTSPEITK